MTYHFDHVHLVSRHPRDSARWWVETFGAELLPEAETRGILFIPVLLDGVKITISGPRPSPAGEASEAAPVPHYGLEHLGIRVDDLDAVVARFAAQGLEVYERRESPLFKVAFVAGPDGLCLELMEPRG